MDFLMSLWIMLIGILIGVMGTIFSIHRIAIAPLHKKVAQLTSDKHALSTTYGKLTEQFAPFMAKYPYAPEQFRFIGSPIDGIQFNKEKVIFVEFKSHTSRLTPLQTQIKHLVATGKVEWFEFRID